MQSTQVSAPSYPSIVEQAFARRDALCAALADEAPGSLSRNAIESAIATVDTMLTGDLAHPADVVRQDLVRWLESNKYLGLRAEAAGPPTTPGETGPEPDEPAPPEEPPPPREPEPAPVEPVSAVACSAVPVAAPDEVTGPLVVVTELRVAS